MKICGIDGTAANFLQRPELLAIIENADTGNWATVSAQKRLYSRRFRWRCGRGSFPTSTTSIGPPIPPGAATTVSTPGSMDRCISGIGGSNACLTVAFFCYRSLLILRVPAGEGGMRMSSHSVCL